jgi:hypothetical protein
MTPMRKVARNIQIIRANMYASLVFVPRGDNPSLDYSIITSSTNLGFAGASTTAEYNRPNNIQMAP